MISPTQELFGQNVAGAGNKLQGNLATVWGPRPGNFYSAKSCQVWGTRKLPGFLAIVPDLATFATKSCQVQKRLPGNLATFWLVRRTGNLYGKSWQVSWKPFATRHLRAKTCKVRGKLRGNLATLFGPRPGNICSLEIARSGAQEGCEVSWQLFSGLGSFEKNVARSVSPGG